MDTRIIHAAAGDGCRNQHSHASALGHFRKVIDDAWRHPSPAHALAKRQLDFLCGHIDAAPGLKDFIKVSVVAAHYSALSSASAGDDVSFTSALRLYLTLLHSEIRNGIGGQEFRGASVALTFDRARHEGNILRFVDDGPAEVKILHRSVARAPTR